MKTVTLEELIELAHEIGVSDQEIRRRIRAIGDEVGLLATECARIMRVEHAMTVLDEAGLCSSFVPREKGDPCPPVLDKLDSGGEFHRE